MKNIGIMTMHRVVNYGSFLQAYGLKSLLLSLGYNVQFVDYNYGIQIVNPHKSNIISKIINNKNIINFIIKKKTLNKFKYEYDNHYLKYLGVSNYNYNPTIDKLVIGSDEVFNCLQEFPVGYSKELFGKNYETIDVISYAASFGHTKLNELKQYNIDQEIGLLLNKFKNISVRDLNSYNIVKELTGTTPFINSDPVLVSDYSLEMSKNKISEKDYIIVYAYPGRLKKQEEKFIKSFAKKHNKKIISLGFFQKIADKNLVVNPFEVLNYFKNADYIITDTFHGCVFSIKTNSKFCAIIRDTNKNKLSYLLTTFKQDSRIVTSLSDIDRLFTVPMNYEDTNKIIELEKIKTIKYLKNSLR